LLNSKGRADDAVASYRREIDLRPEYAEAYNNLGGALKEQGLLEEALDSFRRARELKPGIPEFGSNLVYTMHFHPKYGAKEIAAEHRAWNERHARPLARLIRPHENPRDPERPLRVGMISPDFRNHPIGRFLLPYFAAHDGERYPLFCYSDVVREDELTARLKGHAQQWRSTVGKNHAQVAAMIREDRIDILLDLTMHMQGSRLLVFAQKPAPVQATYLAYCSSTGLETMDYRLTDGHFDPEDLEGIYTERSVRLRSYWCYEASPEAPEVGPLPATQRGYVTFGCLNNFCKVTDPVVTAWARLLRAVPESRLLLHAAPGWHRDVLQRRFTTHAVDGARIDFAGMLPMAEYFELYQGIDIALDPWPYAGGTTTCDGLWMGVPVVTLAGTTGVGRGGVSILKTLGMDELVARDADEYVEVAEALARNGGRMERLRTGLRERMRGSVLMDGQAFARDFETALRKMWREWCRP
jgi:predicted O-linked N-acetylglucosamine transferase (SPINDLY family)